MNPPRRKISIVRGIACALLLGALGLLPASASAATAAPAWKLDIYPLPTNFVPGTEGGAGIAFPEYVVFATNVGAAKASGTTTLTTTLPAGLTPSSAGHPSGAALDGFNSSCDVSGQTVTCTNDADTRPNSYVYMGVPVTVDPGLQNGSTVEIGATVSGGGAPAVSAAKTVTASSTNADFGFLDGYPSALFSDVDGQAITQAGAHPYQLTLNASIATADDTHSGRVNSPSADIRDVRLDLPPGLIVNPDATPVRCTEAQLESASCPPASQIGAIGAYISIVGFGPNTRSLYNMVAPPGYGAELAFFTSNSYIHILGGVRPGDYGLFANTPDLTGKVGLIGFQVQLWGDPSSPLHDKVRGFYAGDGNNGCRLKEVCTVDPQTTPFLTVPGACTASMQIGGSVDSWPDTGLLDSASNPFTDFDGTVTGVDGCAALEFEPTLKARPTTDVADAPTGLEADLKIPQEENVNTLAKSQLRKAVVTLPEGLTINPSGANGLTGCSSAQVGIDPATAVPNGVRPSCPDASRIGSLEVDTPLQDHILPGSVYVATPYDNPFDSLLAIYAIIDDARSGTLVKLAGHVIADPATGRLTTVFDNNPQLPFNNFKLHFFGGASAALRTPAACGTYQTTSQMTPWSGNQPVEPPPDVYDISQSPTGGTCASTPGSQPNSPNLDAGTVSPIAGSYSPMVINLRRDDGSQNFSAVTLTPPPGLIGKLAGIPYCPDSALAAAEGKPGRQEEASPSCPAASKVGTVSVAAGAGPAPYWAHGNAYLTGPYKGAPLSLAIVTPAAAGPYDLGTVVVRTALRVDPETAQITAVSDPIPYILQGIPLDVRQALIRLDRPSFTRNGTSCDPFAFAGSLLSTQGQSAPLSEHFQLGECAALAFKPKLALRLTGKTSRGGNPGLSATLTMPEGGANIGEAVVALPHSEFIDNSHFQTICTRVQFAAGSGHGEQCPAGSAYGFARATSPLLDKPLEGPVFLRSSNHELPDLVMALRGQIDVDLAGRIDSVKGGIRTSFEGVPDAPVSKFTLTMQGGKKGLFENSTNICAGIHRATAEFTGQNGKISDLKPALKNSKCGKSRRKHRHHHRAAR